MKIAALDIGGTEIKYCLYDSLVKNPSLTPLPVNYVKTDAFQGGAALIEKVKNIINHMGKVDRIAISTAGQVDPILGKIIYASDNIPDYTGMQIKPILQSHYHIPVWVQNDVNSAALGELYYGAGKGFSDFLCLTYGTGIGGAIVKDQHIFYGSSYSAGEFGHMITHANGIKCTCSGKGCYEAYASTNALISMVKKQLGLDLNGRQIFSQMKDNDEIKMIVTKWMDEILFGLVSLIHIFNPSCIILGGGIMNENIIIEYIRDNIYSHLMGSFSSVKIKKAVLGNAAGLLGVIHECLKD